MRLLTFFILLLSIPSAVDAAPQELICDADAKIIFNARWIRHSSVTLSLDSDWELPWTGREELLDGHEIRELQRQTAVDEATADALQENLRDSSYFITFRGQSRDQEAIQNLLHIDRNLFLGRESYGLVIFQQIRSLNVREAKTNSKLRLFHCRSR